MMIKMKIRELIIECSFLYVTGLQEIMGVVYQAIFCSSNEVFQVRINKKSKYLISKTHVHARVDSSRSFLLGLLYCIQLQ